MASYKAADGRTVNLNVTDNYTEDSRTPTDSREMESILKNAAAKRINSQALSLSPYEPALLLLSAVLGVFFFYDQRVRFVW